LGKIANIFQQLNIREKSLILFMAILFGAFGSCIAMDMTGNTTNDIEEEIDLARTALRQLSARQAGFVESIRAAEELDEQLRNNTLQVRTFLERQCIETNVGVPTSYNDNVIPIRDQDTGDTLIEELETVATINRVDPTNLSRLLHRIATSDELVLLKALRIEPASRGAHVYDVRITLSTYRYKEEADS
jgi:hypothetical protein